MSACHSCGSSNLVPSDTFGESVCGDCGVVSASNSLVHREMGEGADSFFEGSRRLGGNGLGGAGMYGGGRFSDKEGNRERSRQQRLENAKQFLQSLCRLFTAPALFDRALFLYGQSDARNPIYMDRMKYIASAAFAIVAREKKRSETLKDIAHAADLSVIRLSRVYIKLQASSGIGITEVDPLVFIERHILHLQNICNDPSVGLTTKGWETKGRGKDLVGTLQHIKECDLRAVRRVAIRLSEFFTDIYLFAGRHAMSVSIAIITVAIEGATKNKLSRAVDIPEELSKVNNVASWTVMERYREAGKMFLDWAEYLPGVDLSVRDIVPAGKNTKLTKRRLCRRREIAIITTEVLDQWQSIRDRRVALGLEKSQPPRTGKISELPPVAPTLQQVVESQKTTRTGKMEFEEKMAKWGSTAAVGEDAEELPTWDTIDEDGGAEWSDFDDPLGDADDEEDDAFNAEPVPAPRAISPVATNAVASSSRVQIDGPQDFAYPLPLDDEANVDAFRSHASSSDRSNDDGGSSLAIDPSLLTQLNPSYLQEGLVDPSLLDDGGYERGGSFDADDDYPSPSQHDSPYVPAAPKPKHGGPRFKKDRARSGSEASTNSSEAFGSDGSPVKLTKKGKPMKIRKGPDTRFLRYDANNTAEVYAGRQALPALIPYKPSLPSIAADALLAPVPFSPHPALTPDSPTDFPPAPPSSLFGGGATDAGTDAAAISNRVAVHRRNGQGVRPSAYMRTRPGDVMKNHPYVHLKPAIVQQVRESHEQTTELGELLRLGHTLDDLPIHLAPTSNLGAIAALRFGGATQIRDDELFVDGELEGYVRPPEEREFVAKLWEAEGKWDGLEELLALKEKRAKERVEKEARRLDREERRAANGGTLKYTRSKKTKVTQDMIDKLAALANEDDGGDGDLAGLMREYEDYEGAGDAGAMAMLGGGGPSGGYGSDDDGDKSGDDENEKHEAHRDYDDQYANGHANKRLKTSGGGGGGEAFAMIDPALLGPSGFHQADMEMLNAMRGGAVEEEEDEFGEYV